MIVQISSTISHDSSFKKHSALWQKINAHLGNSIMYSANNLLRQERVYQYQRSMHLTKNEIIHSK